MLTDKEITTLASAADMLECNCFAPANGPSCDGSCTHAELLAIIAAHSVPETPQPERQRCSRFEAGISQDYCIRCGEAEPMHTL